MHQVQLARMYSAGVDPHEQGWQCLSKCCDHVQQPPQQQLPGCRHRALVSNFQPQTPAAHTLSRRFSVVTCTGGSVPFLVAL